MSMIMEDFFKRDFSSIDYFIFGDIISDRSEYVINNIEHLGLQQVSFVQLTDITCPNSIPFSRIRNKQIIQIDKQFGFPSEQLTECLHSIEMRTQKERTHIAVDLNSLDREFLLLLCSLLFSIEKNIVIHFIYFSSEFYDIPKWEALKHEKPMILSTLPGTPCFSSSTLLVLSGFETDALGQLVQCYQPDRLLLGYNKDGVSPETENANKKLIEEKVSFYKNSPDISVVGFPCDVKNPEKCCSDIQAILEKEEIMRDGAFCDYVRIASTNTKLALVGTILFVSNFSDVQVVYAKPLNFQENELSKGVKDYYEYVYER